ncbi:MAG: zinc-binding dehydrogenase [Myxococcales bacterium]|nr:zinc-binding dehydrogenase [Myxococcales bacterium]
MRQIWIPKFGGPEVLEVREAPDPTPGAGEVRIRVEFTGINFADIMARVGLYQDLPKIPTVAGYEVSGVIDAVGPGVDTREPGDRVVAFTRFGGHSEVVVVPKQQVFDIPDNMTAEAAAAMPVNYATAWLMLVRLGNVQPGDKVLVHAVAGGVGQAAVQICNWRGAEVIGTASASKHPRLKEMGVAHVIDYTREDFEERVRDITSGRGVDLVIDAVGGDSFKKSYRSLAPMGRLFMFGASSFAEGRKRSIPAVVKGLLTTPVFFPIALMNANRGVFGVNLGHLWDEVEMLRASMTEMLDLVRAGHLAPVVDRVFPFDQVADAHIYIQDRRNFGKVLLRP